MHLGAALRHEDDVLEADAAVAGSVEPGLDGDDVACEELRPRQPPHAGRLVHLEADAVAEPVEEPVTERLAGLFRPQRRLARRLEDVAREVEDGARVDAGPNLGDGLVESLLAEPMPLANVVGHVADDEGASHVRVDGGRVVAREDVDDERRVRRDRPGAHLVTDGALRAGRDDVLVGARVVGGEDDVHVRFHARDSELLAVEQQLVAADLGSPEKLATRVHRRLGCTLRAAHSRELRVGLRPAAVVEQVLVDVELHAVGPQPVGEPDGEVLGHARALRARGCRRPAARAAPRAPDSRSPRPSARRSRAPRTRGRRRARARGSGSPPSSWRRRAGSRSARRRGMRPAPRAAPRGACRASGTSRRRSEPRLPQAERS